jgi:hypothetical protein
MCDCLNLTFEYNNPALDYELSPTGTYNGFNTYEFTYYGTTYYIWHDASSPGDWNITEIIGAGPYLTSIKNNGDPCPIAVTPVWLPGTVDYVETTDDCDGDCGHEDRQYFEYKSIKLPKVCVDQDRGLEDCCCEQLVLAKVTNNSWETDKTSAWMKLSDPADSVTFELYKDNVLTTYTPTAIPFQNEPNAYYTTIDWIDVLNLDGVGCYELKISYDISGILGTFTWGKYRLLPFTIKNALKTARIRAYFDAYHEIEQINFTGSNVESTFRFYGYIGNRQPNMEIDNIIYDNREMKRVIRENLNEYEISVDPSLKCITQPLIDFYFLSENELFISDYNAHNHDYCINDLPVIVSQSPEIQYFDFSRKAGVTCVVSDKFKNKRTYY